MIKAEWVRRRRGESCKRKENKLNNSWPYLVSLALPLDLVVGNVVGRLLGVSVVAHGQECFGFTF